MDSALIMLTQKPLFLTAWKFSVVSIDIFVMVSKELIEKSKHLSTNITYFQVLGT